MDAPFVVGKPVTGKYFIDRKDELKKINSILSSSKKGGINNIALLAQKRTGKSSILYNLKEKDQKTIYVRFDAYGISTKERFAKSYMNTILDAYVKKTGDRSFKLKLKKTLSDEINKLKNKTSGFDVTILEVAKFHAKFKESDTNPNDLLEKSLNFAEVLAKEKKIFVVMMIDEFQELLKWKSIFLQIFRKIMQSQNNVSYILSGSAPTTMQKLVYDSKSPLYRQLIYMRISKLSKKDVIEFIKKRFASAKIKIDADSSEYLFELSRGYPDYVQRLGMEIFLLCLKQNKRNISIKEIDKAYGEMLSQLDADFGNSFDQYADLEKEILIALANSKTTVSTIALEIRKPQSTIPKTMTRLITSDVVERYQTGKYRISDGVFADWIKNQNWGRT